MAIDIDDAMRSGAVSMKAAKKHGTGKHAGYGPQPGVKGPKAKGSMPMATHKQEGALGAVGAVSLKRVAPMRSEYQNAAAGQAKAAASRAAMPRGAITSSITPTRKPSRPALRSAASARPNSPTSTRARAARSRPAAASTAAAAKTPSDHAARHQTSRKLAIRHRGRTIMARKKHHESQHDDDTELAVDDEPEAGWTEDTHAEQHEGEEQPPEPPLPPPGRRHRCGCRR